MNRRVFLLGIAGTAITFAGCNQRERSDSQSPTGTPAETASPTATNTPSPAQTTTEPTNTPTETAPADLVSDPDVVRTCGTSASVSALTIDDNRNPTPESIRAGPLVFLDADQWLSQRGIVNDLWLVKLPAVITGSAAVTLVVPEAERTRVTLNYGGNAISSLTDGQLSVRFEPCTSVKRTGFPGGIVTTGPQRVSLTVWVDDEQEPRDVTLPVGARYWDQ